MSHCEFLRNQGIKLNAVGNELRLSPKEKVTSEIVQFAKAHKQEILLELKPPEQDHIKVFSNVLNREVFISWDIDKPDIFFLEGVCYKTSEIDKMTEMPLSANDLRAIHAIKGKFDGELVKTH